MLHRNLAILVSSGRLAIAAGCSKPAGVGEARSETKTETVVGTVTEHTAGKRVDGQDVPPAPRPHRA